MSMQCSFLVLGFKALDYTIDCITSIFRFEPDADVFFLDNGSDDGSADIIINQFKNNPLFKGYKSSRNLGVAGGRNYLLDKYLIEATTSQICIFIDNDARLDNEVSTRLDTILSDKQIGFVGQLGYVIDPHFNYIPINDTAREVDLIAGYFSAFRRDLLLEIGTLDKVFETHFYGGEDFDFCLRAKAAGYKIIVDPVLPISHHGRASSSFFGDELENYINETNVLLFQRWKNSKHLWNNKNPDLVAQLVEKRAESH